MCVLSMYLCAYVVTYVQCSMYVFMSFRELPIYMHLFEMCSMKFAQSHQILWNTSVSCSFLLSLSFSYINGDRNEMRVWERGQIFTSNCPPGAVNFAVNMRADAAKLFAMFTRSLLSYLSAVLVVAADVLVAVAAVVVYLLGFLLLFAFACEVIWAENKQTNMTRWHN